MRGRIWFGIVVAFAVNSGHSSAGDIELLRRKPDPYGYPRPAAGASDVPVGTSFFLQVGFKNADTDDAVLADSISIQLESDETGRQTLLGAGRRFADGYFGKLEPSRSPQSALAINLDGGTGLRPATTYTVSVAGRSRNGAVLDPARSSWQFTTTAADPGAAREVPLAIDLSTPPVAWRGGFFTGFCKPSFCTSAANRISGYQLMDRVRQWSPRAWSLQRDFSPTSDSHQPAFLDQSHPNVVRERETRRITAIEPRDDGVWLRVEDFFGHQQYGIASGRPLAGDYSVGDTVLIADGISDATAKVLKIVSDSREQKSLLVSAFDMPAAGWKIDYARPLPTQEDPNAPGLFPPGGCYLRKFRPAGTPHYFWGRLDKEWDIAVRQFDRRLVVNFTDAPGDLAVDGRNWTYPKDYAQYHEVVRAMTSHVIQRYGDASLDFVWSVLNEPDLARAFWRSGDWIELQKFYDYTVDAILRSFEDHGYDSDRVVVGGLEIGAIFGAHIDGPILKKFLCHCSPSAACEGALAENAAFADRRLDGKRSRRVERLCGANAGQGSPCDFISVHTYNGASVAAAKLRRAKELALEVDADYFAELWVNSFESCPNWAPPPDVAAADSYLGNGYFATWCADVVRRQIAAAADDRRFGFGETILTFWPWPNSNFGGHNNATQVVGVDEDGDGTKDREETLPLPIMHWLALLANMGDRFWTLPEHEIGGHVVSGFAARGKHAIGVLVYSHDETDIQSRAEATFDLQLNLAAIPWRVVSVREYRFDKDHNSFYRLGRKLRDQRQTGANANPLDASEVETLLAKLHGDDPDVQIAAIEMVAEQHARLPEAVLMAALQLYQSSKEETVRAALETAGRRILGKQQIAFAAADVERVRALSQLQVTRQWPVTTEGGVFQLRVPIAANGSSFLVLEPADTR